MLDLDYLKAAVNGNDVVFHLATNPDVRAILTKIDYNQSHLATNPDVRAILTSIHST
jgi:hypothetical protein